MEPTPRVLDLEAVPDLAAYVALRGGKALRVAIDAGPDAVLAVLEASGLRGRGGAGFPTALKWRSVLDHRSADEPPTVVVNAAEGEPGSFKDRAIIRANPYRVIEGALIAAATVGADQVVVATKASATREAERLRSAIDEIESARWLPGVQVTIVEGPDAYLYGEETALLEVVQGRQPFPRIAPPWRRGVGLDDAQDGVAPASSELGAGGAGAPPALVNNVETLANVALIVANGPEWFRSVGTEDSPGTIVCTITGHLERCGVIEVPMGTRLSDVIAAVGGRPIEGPLVGAMAGVSNRLLPADVLDTELTYEAMAAVGAGLGTAGFVCFDSSVDPVAVAHGVARFLAVESCGQCTPCKQDGLGVAAALDRLRQGSGSAHDIAEVSDRLATIEVGARCYLATQHQLVVASVLDLYPEAFEEAAAGRTEPSEPYLIAELVDMVEGPDGIEAVYDEGHLAKQPDWTYDEEDSGQAPADRLDQAREVPVGFGH